MEGSKHIPEKLRRTRHRGAGIPTPRPDPKGAHLLWCHRLRWGSSPEKKRAHVLVKGALCSDPMLLPLCVLGDVDDG